MLEKESRERERLASSKVENILEQVKALEAISSKPKVLMGDLSVSSVTDLKSVDFKVALGVIKEEAEENSVDLANSNVVKPIAILGVSNDKLRVERKPEKSKVVAALNGDKEPVQVEKTKDSVKKVMIVDQPDDTDSGIHLKCKDSLPKKELTEDVKKSDPKGDKTPEGAPGQPTVGVDSCKQDVDASVKEDTTGNNTPSDVRSKSPESPKQPTKNVKTPCTPADDKSAKDNSLADIQEAKPVASIKGDSRASELGKTHRTEVKVVDKAHQPQTEKESTETNTANPASQVKSSECSKVSPVKRDSLENDACDKKIKLSDGNVAAQNEARSDAVVEDSKTAAVSPKKSNLKKDTSVLQVKKKVHFENDDCQKTLVQGEQNLINNQTKPDSSPDQSKDKEKKEAKKQAKDSEKTSIKSNVVPQNKGNLKARIDASLQIVDKALSGLGVKNTEEKGDSKIGEISKTTRSEEPSKISKISESSKADRFEKEDLQSIEPAGEKHQIAESDTTKNNVAKNEVPGPAESELTTKNDKTAFTQGSAPQKALNIDNTNKPNNEVSQAPESKRAPHVEVTPMNESDNKFEEVSKKLKNDVLLTVVDKAIEFSASCQKDLNLKDINTKVPRSIEKKADLKLIDTHFKPITSLESTASLAKSANPEGSVNQVPTATKQIGKDGAFKPYVNQVPMENSISECDTEINNLYDFHKMQNGFDQVQQFFNNAFTDLGQFQQNSFYKLEKLSQNERILKSSAARFESAKSLKFPRYVSVLSFFLQQKSISNQ